MICRYVALFVSDLRAAESFYRSAFGLELRFREGTFEGREHVLPDRDWDELEDRGVSVDMLALDGDGFLLALFRGDPKPGTVLEIGLGAARDEIAAMRARLPQDVLLEHEEGFLHFRDPFGYQWTVMEPETPFVSILPELPAS